jgi:hypothetical protein
MPEQECNLLDERLKFNSGLLDGEKMAVLPSVRRLAEDRLQNPRSV